MGLVLAVGLLLASAPRCERRAPDLQPPPEGVFSTLGNPVLLGLEPCPEGEVPVLSPPLSVGPLPRKPRPISREGCQAYGCWAWAGWNDRRWMRGTGARLSVEAPGVSGSDHSLAEVSLQWGPDHQEIVEIGWEVAPRWRGDTAPHLFVHRWVGGRPCDTRCPFRRWSRRIAPGMSLGRWTGKNLAVGWLLHEGRAWAWADGEWLGAFDVDPPPEAPRVAQWFGEVFFVRPPPRVAMGNGQPVEAPGAARIAQVCDVPTEGLVCVVRPERLPRVTEPELYRIKYDGPGSFRYGGPGEPPAVTPRPPPSSASGGTPSATGR